LGLDEYIEISGQDVKDAQRGFVTANILRAQVTLESALGFPLDPENAAKNLYNERGKTQSDYWPCDVADEDLLAPDDEPDAVYRIFNLWSLQDRTAHIDPCLAVTRVKLIHGDVTVHTYETNDFVLRFTRGGFGRLIDLKLLWLNAYSRPCGHTVQVAVDADWLGINGDDPIAEPDSLPDDLKSVWAELVTFLSDKTRFVKSENRGTRSYSKTETPSPLDDVMTRAVLARYAGPRGIAGKVPV
jgi:hypothetical protein